MFEFSSARVGFWNPYLRPPHYRSIATAVGIIFIGVVNLVLFASHQQNKNGAKHADVETLKNLNVPQNSLFRIFQPQLVSLEEVKAKGFGAALSIV